MLLLGLSVAVEILLFPDVPLPCLAAMRVAD